MTNMKLQDDDIEVLAGDVPRGLWKFDGAQMTLEQPSSEQQLPVYLNKNIRSIQVRLRKKTNNLDNLTDFPVTIFLGAFGGKVFGPLNGVATSVVNAITGSAETICIGLELKDGRKMIARLNSKTYERVNKLKSFW